MLKQKEDYILTHSVHVDGKEPRGLGVTVKISFNTEKGTIAITPKLTTKQLSFNEAQASAILQQSKNMLDEAYQKGLELTRDWLEDNRPEVDNQLSIFDQVREQSELDPEEF